MPAHPSISASLGPLLGPSSLPGDWSLVISRDAQVTIHHSPLTVLTLHSTDGNSAAA